MPLSRMAMTSSAFSMPRRQRDLAFGVGVLGGIGQQVADDLRQAQRVGFELHVFGAAALTVSWCCLASISGRAVSTATPTTDFRST